MQFVVSGMTGKYVDDGFLVYGTDDGAILAHPFDADALEFTGEPTRIAESVGGWLGISRDFAVSPNGAFAYVRGSGDTGEVVVISRDARITSYSVSTGLYVPRLSPNGDLIAYESRGPGGTRDS